MSPTYKYPRPAITADCVVFALDEEGLKVLLIQRGQEPFRGQWALPGGFAEVGESLEDTARRELEKIMSAAAIQEMMNNWNKIEANVRAAYPDADAEQVYQLTKTAMNASLGM